MQYSQKHRQKQKDYKRLSAWQRKRFLANFYRQMLQVYQPKIVGTARYCCLDEEWKEQIGLYLTIYLEEEKLTISFSFGDFKTLK